MKILGDLTKHSLMLLEMIQLSRDLSSNTVILRQQALVSIAQPTMGSASKDFAYVIWDGKGESCETKGKRLGFVLSLHLGF